MAWWKRERNEISAHPVDTRVEVLSEGLSGASEELQDLVKLLNQKYFPDRVEKGAVDGSSAQHPA